MSTLFRRGIALLMFATPLLVAQPRFAVHFGTVGNDAGISAGVAWSDVDDDGDLDLFVANWGNQPNALYRNEGDGSFTRLDGEPFASDSGFSSGPAFGDIDNDGYPDLFVSNQQNQNNFLYRNRGDGSFERVVHGDIVNDFGDSYSAAWADYDGDGWLDLVVANHSGQPNFLYRNTGDGTFTAIRDGAIVRDAGSSFGVSWGDMDGDGDPDLFVANKNGESNALYRNNGDGTFTAIREGPVVADGGDSNGGSWGDFDNDGDLDLFVANGPFFFAGARDFLYRNAGDGTFARVENDPVVTDSAKSMSGTWGDIDNDGDLDLFVTTYVHDDRCYLNNGDGTFQRVRSGLFVNLAGFSSGNGLADADRDGDLDLFLANWQNANNLLWRNESPPAHWLTVRLEGASGNRMGVGARVTAVVGDPDEMQRQMREIAAGHGFRSQSAPEAHFGLGAASAVDTLRIAWPSGETTVLTAIPADAVLTIHEADGMVGREAPAARMAKPGVADTVRAVLETSGIAAAVAAYHGLRDSEPDAWDFGVNQLNALGYRLMGAGRLDAAVAIFRLNAERFPDSPNVFDSLADGLAAAGDGAGAVAASRQVLERIDSGRGLSADLRAYLVNTARYRIKHLGVKPSSGH